MRGTRRSIWPGMCLTDDDEVPAKWRIPLRNEDRRKGLSRHLARQGHCGPGLHASFALDAAGDQTPLYDEDGTTLLDT